MNKCVQNSLPSTRLDLLLNYTQAVKNVSDEYAPTNVTTGSQNHMTWWVQVGWSSVFSIMVFIAVWGNLLFMWIVLTHRPMRRVTNFLLVNLSIADLMMAVVNCMFNFIYMLHRDWWFGETYCIANNFMATLTVSASVFTLTGVTIDRYLAIVKPLQPRMSKAAAEFIIVLIWSGSIVLASPGLLFSSTIVQQDREKNSTYCILVWPDGPPTVSHLDRIYNLIILLMTYIFPMLVMIICYTAMSRELRRTKAIGEMTPAQQDSIRSKRKIVRMFVFIVVTFGTCWLPYHGYFIYTNYYNSVLHTKFIQHVYLAFYWLAMCNAMVNPFIYYWMNNRFRKHFMDAVCNWKSRKSRKMSTRRVTLRISKNHHSQSFSRCRSDDRPPGIDMT